MHRALLVLGLLLAAPALAQAQGCAEACVAPMPPFRSVWTVFTTVQAEVHDDYAIVRVIEDIGNRGPDPEFPFQVRVPDEAFVSGLTIIRDGVAFHAGIAPRDQARQQYEQTKSAGQTGGLVEQQRGTSVVRYLINVAEFTSVRAILTYERALTADQGVLSLPLEAPVSGFGQDRGARFEVSIGPAGQVPAVWSSPAVGFARNATAWSGTYAVGPRSGSEAPPTLLNVSWAPNATGEAGDLRAAVQNGTGFFAHRFRAPADAQHMPLDLVLVLDTSGSMAGLKMRQLQDAASQVVKLLRPGDRLHLVFFSSDAASGWPGLRNATDALRLDAGQRVQDASASGATNIEAALRLGFGAFGGLDAAREEQRLPVLVLLTDGQPTAGLQDRAALRSLARDLNVHGAHVFGLAFGQDADWGLVAGFAHDGNGTAIRVPEGAGAEVDIRRFVAALTTPVLRNVRVLYDGDVTAFQRDAPVLFAGSELLVLGRFDARMTALHGNVTAQGPDGPRRYAFTAPVLGDGDAGVLPRLVAYQEIRQLLDVIAAEGSSASLVQRVTDLAMRAGFVTDYTSLVVSLPPDAPPMFLADCATCGRTMATSSGTAAGSAPASTPMPGPSSPAPSTGTPTPVPVTIVHDKGTAQGSATPQQQQQPQGLDTDLMRREAAKTPGFEALAALAAVGLAAMRLRRK